MATIPFSKIVLHDTFPGTANPNLGIPRGGWDNTVDNCVTVATYPMGTKIQGYTDNSFCPGYYTMMYAGYASYCSAADISTDFSDGWCWCMPFGLTSSTNDTTYEVPDYSGDVSVIPIVILTNCYTATAVDFSTCQMGALPCATLEGYDHGWFWVGGVCPCADITIMQSGDTTMALAGADMTTDGNVTKGSIWLCASGSSHVASLITSMDYSSIVDATVPYGTNPPMPFAHATDID